MRSREAIIYLCITFMYMYNTKPYSVVSECHAEVQPNMEVKYLPQIRTRTQSDFYSRNKEKLKFKEPFAK